MKFEWQLPFWRKSAARPGLSYKTFVYVTNRSNQQQAPLWGQTAGGFWRSLAKQASGRPPCQMAKSWSCEILSLERYKYDRNKEQWHQCFSALVPESIGLWGIVLRSIYLSPSLISSGTQRGCEPKKMISHCFWFLKRTPRFSFRMCRE